MRKPLSIYVHIPFCKHKCMYCDFLSFEGETSTKKIQYINALMSEIRMYKPYADRYIVKTIYIGGGTPSFLDEAMIGNVINTIKHIFKVDRFPEITIEVKEDDYLDVPYNLIKTKEALETIGYKDFKI